ncbi:baseplate J/gp47 family protein [Kushneria phosphatilytica]|uniref:Baseplate assembly protein n=1 Tax=Kushneria phosphatilytica TaxID=657387 RepID=A0A1S1NVP6_9GAMM|nr:baseplate J/gp47 family protein [Kushneria phosphatilytica]OHV11200.1 baseplate assembly protein [Kushneria phosphatilytica]QEL12227.1 baseplate assembly protein [Kushneria phosphatilytica]
MSSPIDLSQLPAPAIVETLDYESILAERKQRLVSLYDADEQADIAAKLELESEPITKLLEENAYREVVLRQRVNEAARAVMLAYAGGDDLTQLAANYNVTKLTVDPGDPDAVPPVPPTLESDTDLRLRAQRAFDGLSVAGPRAAYVFHALSADGRVADATAISPSPCVAIVTVLAQAGTGEANAELLDIVEKALSAEDIRPVGDRLTVQSARIVDYAIDATLYLYPGPEQEPIIAAAQAKAETYVSEQRRLGRDIRLSAIYAALHVEGVQRVELTSPSDDLVIDETQASHCTGITIANGGTDE